MVSNSSRHNIAKEILKRVRIRWGKGNSYVVFVMFLVNPIKLRLMQRLMRPIKQEIFCQHEKYKLREHCLGSRPFFKTWTVLNVSLRILKQRQNEIENKEIKKYCAQGFSQKKSPLSRIALPRPGFLNLIKIYILAAILFEKWNLSSIDEPHHYVIRQEDCNTGSNQNQEVKVGLCVYKLSYMGKFRWLSARPIWAHSGGL